MINILILMMLFLIKPYFEQILMFLKF